MRRPIRIAGMSPRRTAWKARPREMPSSFAVSSTVSVGLESSTPSPTCRRSPRARGSSTTTRTADGHVPRSAGSWSNCLRCRASCPSSAVAAVAKRVRRPCPPPCPDFASACWSRTAAHPSCDEGVAKMLANGRRAYGRRRQALLGALASCRQPRDPLGKAFVRRLASPLATPPGLLGKTLPIRASVGARVRARSASILATAPGPWASILATTDGIRVVCFTRADEKTSLAVRRAPHRRSAIARVSGAGGWRGSAAAWMASTRLTGRADFVAAAWRHGTRRASAQLHTSVLVANTTCGPIAARLPLGCRWHGPGSGLAGGRAPRRPGYLPWLRGARLADRPIS
jgi:hypothetical protein